MPAPAHRGFAPRSQRSTGSASSTSCWIISTEGRVGLGGTIFGLEIEDQRHQRLVDVAAAERAEMPARVGLLAQAVRPRGGLVAEGIGGHDRLAALRKAVILSISLTPGVVSTPEDT